MYIVIKVKRIAELALAVGIVFQIIKILGGF